MVVYTSPKSKPNVAAQKDIWSGQQGAKALTVPPPPTGTAAPTLAPTVGQGLPVPKASPVPAPPKAPPTNTPLMSANVNNTAPPPPPGSLPGSAPATIPPYVPTFEKYGGKDAYVANQNTRWQQANESGDTDLMGRLTADSKRAGYTLNPYVSKETQEYNDWKARTDAEWEEFNKMTGEKFAYDPNTDPAYLAMQSLAKLRAQDANKATMETMNSRGLLQSTMTNSQLDQNSQRAEQEAMAYIPEFRNQAYTQHRDSIGDAGDRLSYATGRGDEMYDRSYQKGRDGRSDMESDRAYNYGVGRDKVADERYDDEFDYQVGRDKVADDRYNEEFKYTQGRDKVADQRWQDEFDRIKEQDGIQNALAWAQQSLAEDDSLRQWTEFDYETANAGEKSPYEGMTANQVLDGLRSNYSEPTYDEKGNKTGSTMTQNADKRYQMFLDVADSGLSDTETNQLWIQLGFTKEQIKENKERVRREDAAAGN